MCLFVLSRINPYQYQLEFNTKKHTDLTSLWETDDKDSPLSKSRVGYPQRMISNAIAVCPSTALVTLCSTTSQVVSRARAGRCNRRTLLYIILRVCCHYCLIIYVCFSLFQMSYCFSLFKRFIVLRMEYFFELSING